MHLDERLNFHYHVKEIIAKASKGVGIIHELANMLPTELLVTIYDFFVRPHRDYDGTIYENPIVKFCVI